MKRYFLGGLILLLTLSLTVNPVLGQEEEVYPPVEETAYSPEEVIPVVEPPAPPPVTPTNAVQNIEVEDLPEKVRIIIHTTQPAEYIIGKLYKSKMLYIDILNSVNDLPRKRFRVQKGPVERIRSSQYQVLPTEISRIVVDLDKWAKHEVAREETKLYIEFYKPEVVVAKVSPEEEVPVVEEKISPEEEEKALPSEEKLVSLSFTDAPMSAVLNFLAEMSGYNIVASAEVTAGTVTINLKDVPVMTALSTILEMQGLWYTKERNIVKIMTMDEFLASRAAKAELTRVYPLQYAVANDLATVLNSVLGGAVKKETPTKISRLESAEAIEKYMEIAGLKFTGKTFVIADKRTNSLIVTTDAPDNLIMLEKLIKQLDTEVPQVLIQVMIVEVTLTDTDILGIDWAWYDIHTGTDNIRPELRGTMRFDSGSLVNLEDVTYTSTGPYKLWLHNSDVSFLIQALSKRNPINILSSPRILTLDNQEAKVKVVREYPLLTSIKVGETTTTRTYTYKEMGVTLTVTPQINPDKFVRLKLKIESQRDAGPDPYLDLAMFDKRETTGSMLIKDSQTLIMGGMIQEEVVDTFTKVPVLGSIPGLGLLFRKKEHKKTRVELMIFVTPYVIASPGEGRVITEKQKEVLATPPPEDLRIYKEETPIGKDLKGMKGERWWRKRRKERKKPVKVEEEKIEIPELEETKIPEIEEKKK